MNQKMITNAPSRAEQEPMQHRFHRFIDEAGDMAFFGRGGFDRLGSEGVSKAFMLGMVRLKQPLPEVRAKITSFIQQVAADPFFNRIPSIRKRLEGGSMFLHASRDPSELRSMFFELLRDQIDFSLQVVVGRKQTTRFINKHHSQQTEFYADLLSHLLKDKANHHQLVLNIADLGNTTRLQNLRDALSKAHLLYRESQPNGTYKASVVFNVQPYDQEPLLAVADYSLWAVQRIFERGETRFYDMIVDKVSLVVDLYDTANSKDRANYYTPKHPLTKDNMLNLNS